MRRVGVVVAVVGIACGSSPPQVPARVREKQSATKTPVVGATSTPSATTPALPAPPRLGLQETLCGERAGCVVKTAFAGAPGKDGDARAVVLVPTKLSLAGGDEPPQECQANEVWVVRTAADGAVVDRQLVGEGCVEDTPYGVACDGLMIVRVQPATSAAPKTAVVSWEGPGPGCGGWTRGNGDVEVSLDSFSVLRRSEWAGRAREPDDSHTRQWDFAAWSFTTEWDTGSGDCPTRKRGPAFAIPKLALESAFVEGGWQTANMDRCATSIDSNHGVALPGSAKSTAVLRAVMSDTNALFIEVEEGPRAKAGGELQVCFAEWNAHSYDYCHMPIKPDCVRVALDGQVRSGAVVVEKAPDKPRFRVQLPSETGALSVSYLEPGGRSISSSAYRKGDATSLGNVFSFGPPVATCHLDADGLQLTTPRRKSDEALLDTEGLE